MMPTQVKKSKKNTHLIDVIKGALIVIIPAVFIYFFLPSKSNDKASSHLKENQPNDTIKPINPIISTQQGDNNSNATVTGNQNTVIQGKDNKVGNDERTVIENHYYIGDTNSRKNKIVPEAVESVDNIIKAAQPVSRGRILTDEDKQKLDELNPANLNLVRIYRQYFDGETIQYGEKIQAYLKQKPFRTVNLLATREKYYSLTERFFIKYGETGRTYDIYIYSLIP